MFKRQHKLEDSTDDVIGKMVERTPANIVIKVGENRFLIPVDMVKNFAINSLPDALVDEKSEDAKKFGALRSALKAGLRPFLPDILRKTWGREVEVRPHLNILSWLPLYFIHFFIGSMARLEWRIDVKDCEGCGDHVYQVLRLAPNVTPEQPLADNRQSLPGRGESSDSGKEDSNLAGGSLGDSGNDGERKDDNGKGAIVTVEAGVSSG
jgi:hypothetical protein